MSSHKLKIIILAAGKGSRMKSTKDKVLHPLGNRPMIEYVLDTARQLKPQEIITVVAPNMESVQQSITDYADRHKTPLKTVIQDQQLGTGHAVLSARKHLEDFNGDILVLYADTPLIQTSTLEEMIRERQGSAIVLLGMRAPQPNQYGRIIASPEGWVEKIVEHKDASPQVLKDNPICNPGVMLIDGSQALSLLDQLDCNNAKGEA